MLFTPYVCFHLFSLVDWPRIGKWLLSRLTICSLSISTLWSIKLFSHFSILGGNFFMIAPYLVIIYFFLLRQFLLCLTDSLVIIYRSGGQTGISIKISLRSLYSILYPHAIYFPPGAWDGVLYSWAFYSYLRTTSL